MFFIAVVVGVECVEYATAPSAELRKYTETEMLAPSVAVPVEAIQLKAISIILEKASTKMGAAI